MMTVKPVSREWQEKRCGAFAIDDRRVCFRVWAPKARGVQLVLIHENQTQALAMQRESGGHFTLTLDDVRDGQRYGYRLDNGPLRPDPCSRWQPDGVHQPSAVALIERFEWHDQQFAGIAPQDLVFYELHVGTFTREGTFDAVIPRLAELKELGITAIELLPVAQFPGARNWGYDGVHLYAPQNTYGGPHALARLVDAAHAHGLAIFLDVVYNHFGPEGNYVGEFGPYYSDRYRTTWGPAFNFDGHSSDPVRQFVLDNVAQWIGDFHFDGLRLDAVHAMYDISPQHILADVKLVADEIAAARGAKACIVAESLLNDTRMLLPRTQGGYQLDAEWNEDFHHAVLAYLTGERHGKYVDFGPIEHLPRVLNETFLLSGGFSHYRGRRWGRPVDGLPGERFVVGIQNHDHIGNRASGERLGALVSPAVQRLAASFMLLSPFTPLLFMGEEYGEEKPFLFFCSFGDHGLIENVRQGRKRDYGLIGEVPDPQLKSSFVASRLSWSWPEGSTRAALRQLYQDLLRARRTWPALRETLRRAAQFVNNDAHTNVVQLVRGGTDSHESETVVAYFNFGDQPFTLTPPNGKSLLFASEGPRYGGQEPSQDQIPPHACVVFGPAGYRID